MATKFKRSQLGALFCFSRKQHKFCKPTFLSPFFYQASSGSGGSLTLQHNSHLLNSADQRKVNLQVEATKNGFIGFNLRGGSEYGLGLFVSG